MNAQDAYALIAGVVAVGGLAAFLFREGTRLARAIAALSERVAVLETDNKTFWNVMGPHMAKIIHEDVTAGDDPAALVRKVLNSNAIAIADTLDTLDPALVDRAEIIQEFQCKPCDM